MGQQLDFSPQEQGVRLNGYLNRTTVPKAWRERQQWLPQHNPVVLDLGGLESVDSSGLAMLIQLKAELNRTQTELNLLNVNEQLHQFAAVSGVTELLSLS